MTRRKACRIGVVAASALGVALALAFAALAPGAAAPDHGAGASAAPFFQPPPESAIPDNEFGRAVRRGEAIFRDTRGEAPAYVGNALRCENCHLDAGRLADASPLWAAYPAFPAYRAKNGHVNTYAERIEGCFRFSMNGKAPPLGDPVLVALEAYSYWLSEGAPVGANLPGRGYPKLPAPATPPDYASGAKIYAAHCALCHGADGAGQSAGGKAVFPPLWGAQSFNWGAGMANVNDAAGFVKANMPLGLGGLTDQQAWDVALFMDSHERPKDPRFFNSLAATRAKFHNSRWSMYGKTVNGHLLGTGP
jgi:thiosulfate dehydrogenase